MTGYEPFEVQAIVVLPGGALACISQGWFAQNLNPNHELLNQVARFRRQIKDLTERYHSRTPCSSYRIILKRVSNCYG